MTRYSITYTGRGPEVFQNVRKADTGEPLILMDEGEAKKLSLNLAPLLETGETVSSATIDTKENVTASIANSTTAITLTLSNATSYYDGKVIVLITLSSGEIIRQTIRVRRTNRFNDESSRGDYQ